MLRTSPQSTLDPLIGMSVQRTITRWALLAAGALALTACGTDPNRTNTEPADVGTDVSGDAQVDIGDTSNVDAVDDSGVDAEPTDTDLGDADVNEDTDLPDSADTDPDVIPQPSTWCVPHAVPYDLVNAPALFVGVLDVCFDGVIAETGVEAEVTETIVVGSDLQTITVDSSSTSGANSHTVFELFDDGSVHRITDGGFEGFYSTGYGLTTYTFNERGQLIHKLAQSLEGPDGPVVEEIEKTQEWDGELLVSRLEVDGLTDEVIRDFRWTYDDAGVLTQAQLTVPTDGGSREYVADWQVDNGRPQSVSRTIDGAMYETESWQWSDGQLVGRTFGATSRQELLDSHGEVAGGWAWPGGLDDFEVARQADFQANPWPAATVVWRDDCAVVPRGPGHGYPAAEQFYDLGVPRDDRMSRVGFMYGNDGFGWNYGDQAWYGHMGLGTSWFGYPNGELPSITSEIEYDAQLRMTSEMTRSTGPEATAARLVADRTRSFDNNGIVSDTVSLDEYGVVTQRGLAWDRNAQGRPVRRELMGSDALIEAQDWVWRGDWVAHTIHTTVGQLGTSSWFGGFRIAIETSSTPSWTYNPSGAWIARESGESGNGVPSTEESREFDDEGRIIALNTGFETRTYAYDDDGREVSQCYESSSLVCTLTDYDEYGRVIQRSVDQGTDAEPIMQFSSALTCESTQ